MSKSFRLSRASKVFFVLRVFFSCLGIITPNFLCHFGILSTTIVESILKWIVVQQWSGVNWQFAALKKDSVHKRAESVNLNASTGQHITGRFAHKKLLKK